MRHLKGHVAALCLTSAAITAPLAAAQNNGLPSQTQSAAFLETVANLGRDCGLLKSWQSLSIRALLHEDTKRMTAEKQAEVKALSDELDSEFTCETEAMTVWIDGASQGFESEMLAPYLVAYMTLAKMESPPDVFSAVALRTDYSVALAAIEAKLDELEASGRKPEGGGSWPDYIAKTATAVEGFATTLNSGEVTGHDADRAAAWTAQSALIVESWLAEAQ
ncbi:MAG: hypothetical protein WA989_12640 [Henriciella sp.]|uniref:hypothetical protein n=1 Tax=Henriciella sp. TaxID=1968823 RepID=UPI003C706E19